jgi:hypothetical protein
MSLTIISLATTAAIAIAIHIHIHIHARQPFPITSRQASELVSRTLAVY